jgi:alkylation response protein AidB-like acyl-CoA dehydrogenase
MAAKRLKCGAKQDQTTTQQDTHVSSYNPPLDDINFCVRHLAGIEDTLTFARFDGIGIDDLEQILDEAGKFARDVIAPTNVLADQQGISIDDGKVTVPDEIGDVHHQYVENGWPSVAGSPDYGGMGLPATIAYATSEMTQTANVAYSLLPMLTHDAVEALQAHCSEALKDKFLEKLITGEWSGTMLLTEAQAGSDLGVLTTRAERDGDQFRLYGTKVYITWGEHELSENIIHCVLARIDGAPEGVRGISMFLVPKFLVGDDGEPGARNDIRATSVEHKLGIHASPTCVMNLGDNDGAIGYLVGEENRGLAAMFTMMNHARMSVGLQGLAVSERALQLAGAYAGDRVQGRAPGQEGPSAIVHHPDVRRMLMLMRAQVEAMRALSYSAAALIDGSEHADDDDVRAAAGRRLSLLTPVVKGWCTEVALEVTSLGIQVHGGMGFVEEAGAAQHYRDARILPIYEGTNGIQAADFTGRKIIGDEGRELRALINDLRGIRTEIDGGLDLVEQGLEWLLGNATTDPVAAGTASFNLLMLAGTVLGGAFLARGAAIANSEGSGVDASFAADKEATASFYCAHLLPRAHGYLAALTADPAVTMAIAPEAFTG